MPEENNYSEIFIELINSMDLNYGKRETLGLLMLHLGLDEEQATELYDKCISNDELISVPFTCPMCGKIHYLHNVARGLVDRVENRYESGEYIQDILKDFSASDREKFITGYCDECQKKIFGTEED